MWAPRLDANYQAEAALPREQGSALQQDQDSVSIIYESQRVCNRYPDWRRARCARLPRTRKCLSKVHSMRSQTLNTPSIYLARAAAHAWPGACVSEVIALG